MEDVKYIEHTRGICPNCGAFVMEIYPRKYLGQKIMARCPKCREVRDVKEVVPKIDAKKAS